MNKINLITLKSIKPIKEYIYNYNLPLMGFNSSTKILKGFKKQEYTTGILYLQPANLVAKKTLCAYADTAGCKDPCLRSSGRLGMSGAQKAMTRRTVQYLQDPDGFKDRLRIEILRRETDNYCIRLNGTSDIDWSDLVQSLPNIQFYDYSKVLHRVVRNTLSNYHLTFSASLNSVKTIKQLKSATELGLNIAISFNTKECKGEFKIPDSIQLFGNTVELVGFDETDLRFLDEDGSIGKLTRKGSTKLERLRDQGDLNFFADPNNLQLVA